MPLLCHYYAMNSKIQMFYRFKIIQKSILSGILGQSTKILYENLKFWKMRFLKFFLNIWLSFKMYSMYNIQITNCISCPNPSVSMTHPPPHGLMALKSWPIKARCFSEKWINLSDQVHFVTASRTGMFRFPVEAIFRLLTLMFNLTLVIIIGGIINLNLSF